MSKTIRQIAIKGKEVVIYYAWDRIGLSLKGPSRQIKTFSKILPLERLEAQGAIDLEKLEELL